MPARGEIISEQIHAHHAAPAETLSNEYRISETVANETAEKILKEL